MWPRRTVGLSAPSRWCCWPECRRCLPLFRPLVSRLVRRRVAQDVSPVLDGIHWKLLATGWGLFTLGWWLVASSFWAASVALPGDVRPAYARLADLPRLLVAASLAVVLGFVSLLPGGVGVRELVIYGILAPAPHFGPLRALALAVVVRLIWLAAELLLAVPLYLLPCHPAASNVSQDELATHDRKHEESGG
ncbi:MAG: hypothetical protein KatS3mg110_0272 [Pirellulaceae bacterium]|nr:MAG: hypothetical protein KatS3mg110_0272 [Pirellulaceae bacterium]